MGHKQYIGARYVPVFANPVEWNKALSYENMTIVTYLGNSYTSRKPVPAGVDIGNTEYWVNTGNFNAQVSEYQQQVTELSGVVEKLQKQVDDFANTGTSKYTVFIGDSWCTTQHVATPWPMYCAWNLGLKSAEYSIFAEGGASITEGTYLTMLTTGIARWTTKQLLAVTRVVIAGSANEGVANNTTKLLDNAAKLLEQIKTSFPNVKDIYYVESSYLIDSNTRKNVLYAWDALRVNYVNQKIHIPAYTAILRNSNFQSDRQHPTQTASKVLGQAAAGGIVGRGIQQNHNKYDLMYRPTGGTVDSILGSVIQNNTSYIITLQARAHTINMDFASANTYKLGTWSGPMLGDTINDYTTPYGVFARVKYTKNGETKTQILNTYIHFANTVSGGLEFNIRIPYDENGNLFNATVAEISFLQQNIVYDAERY